jgi:hypothetical protein
MDKQIERLRPYFYSIREIKGNCTLDLLIPTRWKHEVIKYEEIKIIQQDSNDQKKLISIITKIIPNSDIYEKLFGCGLEIIKFNIEEEEKEMLLKEKMKQLEEIFKNSDLDKLKGLNLLENLVENEKQIRVAPVGIGERQKGDRGNEEKTD